MVTRIGNTSDKHIISTKRSIEPISTIDGEDRYAEFPSQSLFWKRRRTHTLGACESDCSSRSFPQKSSSAATKEDAPKMPRCSAADTRCRRAFLTSSVLAAASHCSGLLSTARRSSATAVSLAAAAERVKGLPALRCRGSARWHTAATISVRRTFVRHVQHMPIVFFWLRVCGVNRALASVLTATHFIRPLLRRRRWLWNAREHDRIVVIGVPQQCCPHKDPRSCIASWETAGRQSCRLYRGLRYCSPATDRRSRLQALHCRA